MRNLWAFSFLLFCFLMLTFSMNTLKETPLRESKDTKQNEAPLPTNGMEATPEVYYPDYRDGLSANLKDNNPVLVNILEGLKEESAGVAGWLVGFANDEKVVFYNHAYMLAYSFTDRRFLSAIDLLSLDAGHIQGSIVTNFSFSPSGDYVIINNGQSENDPIWKAKMYLADVRNGSVIEIGSADYFKILNSWSSNSQFFVFADRDGTNVNVYDVLNRTQNSVKLEQGQVKGILVTGKGDIVLETNSIFLLASDSGYRFKDLDIKGNILTARGLDIVYYSDEKVQKYSIDSGENTVLKGMPAGLELRGVTKGQAIFTTKSGSTTMVYNVVDNNLYKYDYTYESSPGLLNWSFSPDSKHCVVLDGDSYRVIDERGNEERAQVDENRVNYRCEWVNNTTFVEVVIQGETNVSADFAIAVYDVKAKQRKILYEQ
ncbi:hypothetical protein DesyoDRAFT_4206 [Desulfosporosinus youngiae DSM 17734]|uniref:Periplasmic component of the Tol biopolymer transport system n=2 Tax=Desulfosporosinus TaxID=79206 RepID=H5XXF9_9FIRM|nr:hypothetical protein DesyoDRAFT_4206 [Desulfosporosinus youngiae DSM 17734]